MGATIRHVRRSPSTASLVINPATSAVLLPDIQIEFSRLSGPAMQLGMLRLALPTTGRRMQCMPARKITVRRATDCEEMRTYLNGWRSTRLFP